MTIRLASRPARCVSVCAREKQIVASALMCAAPDVRLRRLGRLRGAGVWAAVGIRMTRHSG